MEYNTHLKPGDPLPHFVLYNQDGVSIAIKDLLGTQPLVIYFYPKDYTPGCTKEACTFRDQIHEIQAEGAQVIGISSDSPKAHRSFSNRYQLPFTLLSDPGGSVREEFGIKPHLFGLIPGRVTFVVDREGIIQHIIDLQYKAAEHVNEALRALRELAPTQ